MKNILKTAVIIALSAASAGLCAQTEAPVAAAPAGEEIRLVAVHPNPATERLLVEFTCNATGDEILLRVRNAEGKVILRRNLVTFEGGNMVVLPVAALPAGEYVLQLDEGRKIRSARWQKM